MGTPSSDSSRNPHVSPCTIEMSSTSSPPTFVGTPMVHREHEEHLRHGRRLQDRIIIVVAPLEVSHRIERTVDDVDVISFRTLEELDRWRSGKTLRAETIRVDFEFALREIDIEPNTLSQKLR